MRLPRSVGVYLAVGTALYCVLAVAALPAQAQYDGSWSGTTAQNRSISFTVSNGAVTSVSVSGTVTGAGCTESFTTAFSTSRTISNNSFTVTLTPGTSRTSFVLTGNFTSTSAANGTLSFTLSSFIGVPSCAGCGSTTWTATRAGAPAPTPTPFPSNSYLTFIPYFATGGTADGGYVTRVVVTNLSSSANGITVNTINTNGQLANAGSRQPLPAGASMAFSSGEQNRFTNASVQWLAIGSDAPISASVLFDFRFASTPNETFNAVGVLAQTPASSFRAPFLFQRATSTQPEVVEALAIANRSDQANTVTVRLLDETGTQVSSDILQALQGFNQTAFAVSTLPNISSFLANKDTFLGTLSISGTAPFVPMYIGNLGGKLFALPLVATGGSSAG